MRAKYDRGAFVGYEDLPGHSATAQGDRDGLRQARAQVEKALTSCPAERIEPWLAELSVIAPARQHDPMTDELRMTAYSSRLAAYPADVVCHVLLAEVWRFWPSWAELHEACEAATSPRRAMRDAISAELERQSLAAQSDRPSLPTESPEDAAARRARANDVVAEFVSKRRIG